MDPSKIQLKNLITDSNPRNPLGGLIYTDFTTNTEKKLLTMNLFSDVVHDGTPPTGSCLQFSFMLRSHGGYLQVYITDMQSNKIKSIWSSQYWLSSDNWHKIKIDVNYKSSFRFLFTIQSNSSATYELVDDISYQQMTCAQAGTTTMKPTTKFISTTTAAPSHAFDCDYENGFCNWQINHKYKDKFQMKSFRSPSYYLPDFDHTKNNFNGKYAFLLTYDAPVSASIYAIENPNHQQSIYIGPVCFKFWYYIVTESRETNFNLTLYQNNIPIKRFYQADDKGNKWKLGMIQFEITKENKTSDYKMEITANVKSGAIGFDDFKVSYSYCGTGQHAGECYFEGGDCGVKPSNPLAQPNWKIIKGSSRNMIDHTIHTGNGSFFAVDFWQKQQQHKRDQIELTSYLLQKTTGSCVQFWYYIWIGSNPNQTLNFVVYYNYQPKTVWHVAGNQGKFWYLHKETIVSQQLPWKFSFISDGESNGGIIAVDDVLIDTSGPCKGAAGN